MNTSKSSPFTPDGVMRKSILKFGDAPYFFAVNKNKPELLQELNMAQGKLLRTNPYYNEELSTRYLKYGILNSEQLSDEEIDWLMAHDGKISIGCLDNFLPLSDETGEGILKGVIPDFITYVHILLRMTKQSE